MLRFKLSAVCLALSVLVSPVANAQSSSIKNKTSVSNGNLMSVVEDFPDWELVSQQYFLPTKWKPVFENLDFTGNHGVDVALGGVSKYDTKVRIFKSYDYEKFSYVVFEMNGKLAMLKVDSNYQVNLVGSVSRTLKDAIENLSANGLREIKFLPDAVNQKLNDGSVKVSESLIKTLYAALPYLYYRNDPNYKDISENYKNLIIYSDSPVLSENDFYYHFAIRKLAKTNKSLTRSQKQILSYLNRNFEGLANVVLPAGERLGNEMVLSPWGGKLLVANDFNGNRVLVDLGTQQTKSLIPGREYKIFPFSILDSKLNASQLKALKHFAFNKKATSSSEYEKTINNNLGIPEGFVTPKEVINIINVDVPFKNHTFVIENELSKDVLDNMFTSSANERDKFYLLDSKASFSDNVIVLLAQTNNKRRKIRYALVKADKFPIDGETDSYLIWKFSGASDLDLRENITPDMFLEVPRVITDEVANNLLSHSYSAKYLEAAYLTASKVAVKKDGSIIKEKKIKDNYAEELFLESEISLKVISSIKRFDGNRNPYYDVVFIHNGKNYSYKSNVDLKDKTVKIKIKDFLTADEIKNYKPRVF